MNTPLLRLTALVLVTLFIGAPVAASVRLVPRGAAQDPAGEGKKKKPPPPGAIGFEQFAGRDASDKLIKGAATRRMPMGGLIAPRPAPPTEVDSYIREAERERAAGNLEAAVAAYKKAIELRRPSISNDGELQYALGKIYSEMGRYEDAVAEFRYASTRQPSKDVRMYATYELGNAYLDLGKYAEALTAYDETLKILSGAWKESKPALSEQYLPYPHYNKGLAYLGLKQQEEAVAAFEMAARLKPDFAAAHFNLGLTLWQWGRKEAAWETHKRLKEIDFGLADRLAALFK